VRGQGELSPTNFAEDRPVCRARPAHCKGIEAETAGIKTFDGFVTTLRQQIPWRYSWITKFDAKFHRLWGAGRNADIAFCTTKRRRLNVKLASWSSSIPQPQHQSLAMPRSPPKQWTPEEDALLGVRQEVGGIARCFTVQLAVAWLRQRLGVPAWRGFVRPLGRRANDLTS